MFECLYVETEQETERRLQIGSALCQSRKPSIDDAARSDKVSVEQLAIFRWVYFMKTLPDDHPLLPLFWQMFFSLFFSNIPPTPPQVVARSYGSLMLGSSLQPTLTALTGVPTKLAEYHRVASNECKAEFKQFHNSMVQFYSLVKLWLVEESLRTPDLRLGVIRDEISPALLVGLLDTSFWNNASANLQPLCCSWTMSNQRTWKQSSQRHLYGLRSPKYCRLSTQLLPRQLSNIFGHAKILSRI